MPGKKRKKAEREKDYIREAEMYLRGISQAEIANVIGVTPQQVFYDLKLVQKFWEKNTSFNLDQYKIKELAKLDLVEREAWEAWEKSKKEFKSKITKASGLRRNRRNQIVSGSIDNISKTEERSGNPKYLEIILKCSERRSRMLGLEVLKIEGNKDKPLKIIHEHDVKSLQQRMETSSEFREAFGRLREQLQRSVVASLPSD